MISGWTDRKWLNRVWLPLIMTVMLATVPVQAQFETAAVLGTVRDQAGAVLPGARVSLRNTATGIIATTTTDANGDYSFPSVKIGVYRVTAELQGFSVGAVDKVTVTVEARQRVDVTLQVGATTEVVTVTGQAPLLETESSSKGQVIGERQMVNLPILGRTYSSLALLTPGVRQSQSGNQGDISFRREAAYNVNGLRSVYNNFLLDGIDNNFYGTTNQGFSNQAIQPSPDFVAEFRMSVNTYSAEYGRTTGAVMNVSTRSGTNEFHGRLWNYLQNTALNATGFFRPVDGRKPQVNRNQFGFVIGGPVIRDRTFFMLDYEGSRWIQSPFGLASLPTLDQRRGILTTEVRVPYDFVDDTGRTVTAGTVIAAGQPVPMTRFARTVLANLPAPNRAGGGAFGVANNFGGFVRNRLFEDKGDLRLDHAFSSGLNGFARYSHRRQTIQQPGLVTGFSGGNAIGNLATYNQQAVGGLTWTVNQNTILDYRFAVTRLGMDRRPALVGGPSMRDLFGITGLPEGIGVRGGITPQDIGGLGTRIGRQSTNPQSQFPTTINSRLNMTFLAGRHTLKTGYEYAALNQNVDDTNPLYGIDNYGGGFSRPNTTVATNYLHNLADFYFGARNNYQLATQAVAKMRQRFHYWYLQDDFKVNQRLTLNLGVRYELVTPVYDADNRLANFDPTTRSVVLATDGSVAERALRNLDKNNFVPRIGLAYRVNDSTVVRAGYALGYNYWNRMASAELMNTNAPFVTRASVQNTAATIGNICTGNNFAGCFRRTQDGYPTNLLTSPGSVILYMPKDLPWSYVQNWHLTIQRQLTRNTLIDVAYVGNRGVDLPILVDFNQARPLTAAELALPAAQRPSLLDRRPIQSVTIPGNGAVRVGNITAVLADGFSNYNGLQVKIEHRANTLLLLNSFTYAKAIDNSSQVLEVSNGGSPNPQNFLDPRNDKGPSSFDQRFNNTTSVVWEMPVGKGRTFGGSMPAALDAVVGGWVLSSTISLQSGQPLNLRYADFDQRLSDGQPDFLGGVALRPNVGAGAVRATEAQRNSLGLKEFEYYFDRTNITIPTADKPFGNLGRNAVYGFPFYQVDLGVQKNFALRFINEEARLEFRAELFNLFNRTNFSAPNTDARSAAFGRVSSTFDPRIVQFALKLHF
ncbi:MAG: TonB-dependent receptor domain-containing protein [Blastocatellia bacterium]